jgi:hypothetical protein
LPANHEHGGEDRRSAKRYGIFCELDYSILALDHAEFGSGTTVNMSSSGLLLDTDHLLSPGQKIELQVRWPAKLDGRVSLKLVVFGEVIRVRTERAIQAGVRIDRYQFRTVSP